jgi:hypothetical protein
MFQLIIISTNATNSASKDSACSWEYWVELWVDFFCVCMLPLICLLYSKRVCDYVYVSGKRCPAVKIHVVSLCVANAVLLRCILWIM